MLRRPVVRRRGAPLLGTAILGGAAYAAGKSAQRGATREQNQEQRLNQLEQSGYQSSPGQMAQPQSYSSSQMYQPQPSPQAQMTQPQPSPQPQMTPSTMPQQSMEPENQVASAAEAAPDKLAQLKTLGELRQSGVLTEVEFEAEKQKILHA